jgi:hypothetical protein
MTFWARVKAAAMTGLAWGITGAVALLVIGLVALGPVTLAQDYLRTRQQAAMGQAAADYLNKVLAEQQKAQAAQPGAGPAQPAK